MLIDANEMRSLPSSVHTAIAAEQRRRAARNGRDDRHILLIGGSGYIGCPVSSYLLAQGACVRNLDCLVYSHGSAMLGLLSHPRYSFIRGDMGDPEVMARALDGVTDVVVLAGLVGDPITKAFPAASALINDVALRNCLDALDGHGLDKVIFISTCSNYGSIGENEFATEKFDLTPLSLYAKSKVAAEQHLLSLEGKVDYAPTILRFATAFGLAPRMRFDLTVNEFTHELFLNKELVIYDAHTWRPYCHVKDFARLIARVLEYPVQDVAFEVFNAGGDENNHTKQSIVDLINARLPGRRFIHRANSADQRNYRVSFEKVRSRLHFLPQMSVADGIDEILWALSMHMLDGVRERPTFFGNYALPGLPGQPLNVGGATTDTPLHPNATVH